MKFFAVFALIFAVLAMVAAKPGGFGDIIGGFTKDLPGIGGLAGGATGGNPTDIIGNVAGGGNPTDKVGKVAGGATGGNPTDKVGQVAGGAAGGNPTDKVGKVAGGAAGGNPTDKVGKVAGDEDKSKTK